MNALASFLGQPQRPPDTLSYHELQGFLFAVATSPELIRPSELMPEVFGGGEAEYADLEEAQTILTALIALYNDINTSVRSGGPALPADCRFRRNLLANLAEDAPVSGWSRGFLRGYRWLEEDWDGCVPDEHDRDFGLMLMTLTFFGSERLARSYAKELGGRDLTETATLFRKAFPNTLAEFASIARLIQQALLRQTGPAESAAQPSAAAPPPKVGRNDPCPCGSGKKYKKCCGAGTTH